MSEKKENPGFVRVADCRDRHGKLELALWGEDGRGGMVKDIGEIKVYMTQQSEGSKEKKEQSKAWKAIVFSILGGAIVALINYVLHH